jgi:hypothetical protein
MKNRFLQTDEGRRRRVFFLFDWQSYLVSICCMSICGQVGLLLLSLFLLLEKQTSINRLTFVLSSSIGTTFSFALFSFIIDF